MYKSSTRMIKTEGIVLSRRNVAEADRIVTVFTREHGKIRLIAKGIRKTASKRAPYLEIFSRIALVVHQGKTMDSVTQVSPVSMRRALYTDLTKTSIAYFYCELINLLLAEKQEHSEVYELLCAALDNLEQAKEADVHPQSKAFALSLLRHLGFLEQSKQLSGSELQHYIENITERKLRTPKLIRQIFVGV